MLRNAFLYHVEGGRVEAEFASERLGPLAFRGRNPYERSHLGFVPVTGPTNVERSEDPYAISVPDAVLFRIACEEAVVPPYAIRKATEERLSRFASQAGRRPSKEEQREIREDAEADLLRQAASKRADSNMAIFSGLGLLLVDAGSQKRADDLVGHIRRAFPEIRVRAFDASEGSLNGWAASGLPADLQATGKINLETPASSKVAFSYADSEGPAVGDFEAIKTLTREGSFHSIKVVEEPELDGQETQLDIARSNFAVFSAEFGSMIPNVLDEFSPGWRDAW